MFIEIYNSKLTSLLLVFMTSFIFDSSDILIFGSLFVICLVKESTTLSTRMSNFQWNEKEMNHPHKLTLKGLLQQLEENTRELFLFTEGWSGSLSPLLDKKKKKKEEEEDKISFNFKRDEKTEVIYLKEEEEEEEKKNKKQQLDEAQTLIHELKKNLRDIKEEQEMIHLSKLQLDLTLLENDVLRDHNSTLKLKLELVNENMETLQSNDHQQKEKEANLKQEIIRLETKNEELLTYIKEEKISKRKKEEEYIHELKSQLNQQQEQDDLLNQRQIIIMELTNELNEKNNEIMTIKEKNLNQVITNHSPLCHHPYEKTIDQEDEDDDEEEEEEFTIYSLEKKKEKLILEINHLSQQLLYLNEMKRRKFIESRPFYFNESRYNSRLPITYNFPNRRNSLMTTFTKRPLLL